MDICLLGLSGSGKTCYLYTVSYILSKGVEVGDHIISATSRSRQQQLRLNKGVEDMVIKGEWPLGTKDPTIIDYPFDLKIDGKKIDSFTIYDYRGGALDGLKDEDQDVVDDLFDKMKDSKCIIFFIDGDTVLEGLDPCYVNLEHQERVSMQKRLKARNKINYIEALLQDYYERMNRNVPILLTITKRDIFTNDELQAGNQLLRKLLPSVFSKNKDIIAGLLSVTLGENLKNDQGKLKGNLWLNTNGNIHIPILFALLQDIDNDNSFFESSKEARRLIQNLFTSKRIAFYRGGERAYPF